MMLQIPRSATGGKLHEVREWIEAYDAAFRAKNLERLAAFYAPDATILEGSEATTWSEVQDHTIRIFFERVARLDFRHADSRVRLVDDAETVAYVSGFVQLDGSTAEGPVNSRTSETMILERKGGQGWRIRHVHRSAPLAAR